MRRLDLTMIRRPTTAARVCGVTLVLATLGAAVADRGPSEPSGISHDRPLVFEANRGQADEQVKFLARGAGLHRVPDLHRRRPDARRRPSRPRRRPDEARRCQPRFPDRGRGRAPRRRALRRGGPARAISAPTYAGVRYVDVYPGIDLVYYGRPRGLEYDFVVAPGADPSRIALAFDGSDRVEVDADGDPRRCTPPPASFDSRGRSSIRTSTAPGVAWPATTSSMARARRLPARRVRPLAAARHRSGHSPTRRTCGGSGDESRRAFGGNRSASRSTRPATST